MTAVDLFALSPLLVLAAASVAVLLAIAVRRNHLAAFGLAALGLACALQSLRVVAALPSRRVTDLLIVDDYAVFYIGLICAASLGVAILAYGYLRRREGQQEEFYLLLLLATLGSAVLVASDHFASLFLGLEILSVSLYALIAYPRGAARPLEAGVKYLILAAASSAFLLFGMALLYAQLGTMSFTAIARLIDAGAADGSMLLLSGLALMLVGVGFKLGLVPFHMWTPDVYTGAPAPVTAFVATVSKGGMVALLLRFFLEVRGYQYDSLYLVLALMAAGSMLVGNLLALLQDNVKRILAYSSIAHLGYLLVALLAGGDLAFEAVTFYMVAYFATTLAAFGVITLLSGDGREVEALEDYRGLLWRRPWPATLLTASLLSLAGIPLTAGFLAKFYVLAAGVESSLWALVAFLVVNSAVGLYYYLRIIVTLFSPLVPAGVVAAPARGFGSASSLVLTILAVALVWIGIFPSPLISLIETAVSGLR